MTAWRDGGNQVPELDATTTAAVMSNGLQIFQASGDVQILSLLSECVTGNNTTASTLQYNIAPTTGAAATISGASATLASALAGTTVTLDGTALTTAPNINVGGVGLGQTSRGINFPQGIMNLIVGTGPTTGTWRHYIRYRPLTPGATVIPLF